MDDDREVEGILSRAILAGPASVEAVKEASHLLGVVFPDAYQEFLTFYGAALCSGFEIAGLFPYENDQPPMWDHVVVTTLQLRKASKGTLENDLIPMSSDGMGVTFYLRCSGSEKGSIVGIGTGISDVTYSNLGQFILAASTGNFGFPSYWRDRGNF